MKRFWIITLLLISLTAPATKAQSRLLSELKSPIILKGDSITAYRDPAVLYYRHRFYLFFTLTQIEGDGKIYGYVAMSVSRDLKTWSPIKKLTPKDQSLDFSSPGNVIRYKKEWVMCLQTYPRPGYTRAQMPKYATKDARLFTMRSKDLLHWGNPELMKVKGPEASFADMGRMIDPYLLPDKGVKGKWWCFYKQNGVSISYSYDLQRWTYSGHAESGENSCLLIKNGHYVLFHSPANGIGIKTSDDLKTWNDFGELITLGQKEWPWAKGRITAGAAIDLTNDPAFKTYLLFFHGSGPLTETEGDFDKNASIGIAGSNDLLNWTWPGKKP